MTVMYMCLIRPKVTYNVTSATDAGFSRFFWTTPNVGICQIDSLPALSSTLQGYIELGYTTRFSASGRVQDCGFDIPPTNPPTNPSLVSVLRRQSDEGSLFFLYTINLAELSFRRVFRRYSLQGCILGSKKIYGSSTLAWDGIR